MTIRHLLVALSATSVFALATPVLAQDASVPAAVSQDAAARLKALFDADWEWGMRESGRMPDGEGGYTASDHLAYVDPASQERRIAQARQMLAELDRSPLDALSNQDQINAAVFRTNQEITLIDGEFREWEMQMGAIGRPAGR